MVAPCFLPSVNFDVRSSLAVAVLVLVAGVPAGDLFAQEGGPASIRPDMFQGLHFRNIGPSRGGRVTITRPLRLLIDPRVAADGVTQADLEEQLALNLMIRDEMARASEAVTDLGEAKRRLEEAVTLGGSNADRARRSLQELAKVDEALVTREGGSYQRPMLVDQLQYLYGMTTRADQKPGRDAYERLDFLSEALDEHVSTIRRILEATIAEPETGDVASTGA